MLLPNCFRVAQRSQVTIYQNINGTLFPIATGLDPSTTLSPSELGSITGNDQFGNYSVVYTATSPYGNTKVTVPLTLGAPPLNPTVSILPQSEVIGSNFVVPSATFPSGSPSNTTVCET